MKRNYLKTCTGIFLMAVLISATSCKKFLETKQYDRSNEVAFYKTQQILSRQYWGPTLHSTTFIIQEAFIFC